MGDVTTFQTVSFCFIHMCTHPFLCEKVAKANGMCYNRAILKKKGGASVQKLKKYLHPFSIGCLVFVFISVVLYLFALAFSSFADGFQTSVATFLRFLFAKITMWIPFSLAELFILLSPLLLIALIVIIVKKAKKNSQLALRFSISVLSFLLAFASLFLCMQGIGYHTTSLDYKLNLDRKDVSVAELKQTALILALEINKLTESVEYTESGASKMPYSYDEMIDRLNEAYQPLSQKYPFIQSMKTTVKPILLSHPMSYTHITGVYTFFTGESNLNMKFPDYSKCYTAAHEMAHQRGISREDEANFVAFLVCMESTDPYLRYCGYFNLYEYVVNQLYSASEEAYIEVASQLNQKAWGEIIAYAKFFETYADSKTSEISDKVNDLYLKVNGQEQGVKSYGLVVDLAVAYYRKK
jgi:hypothetical protein